LDEGRGELQHREVEREYTTRSSMCELDSVVAMRSIRYALALRYPYDQ
jgi:hypothetical protein